MRLFVACMLPDEVKQRLHAMKQTLCSLGPGVSWVKPENLHITLKFLGETRPEMRVQVCEALRRCTNRPSFGVRLSGVGGFPRAQAARVVWAGLDSGSVELSRLAACVDSELTRLGFPRDGKPFSPHITLARAKRTYADVLLAAESQCEFGYFSVREFCLMKSELRPSGAVYTVLERFPLNG